MNFICSWNLGTEKEAIQRRVLRVDTLTDRVFVWLFLWILELENICYAGLGISSHAAAALGFSNIHIS